MGFNNKKKENIRMDLEEEKCIRKRGKIKMSCKINESNNLRDQKIYDKIGRNKNN